MKTTTLQTVIFDFDYTLADSSQGAIECINFALKEMGLNGVSAEAACRTIGLSLSETFLTLGEHHDSLRYDEFHRPLIVVLSGVTPREDFDNYEPLAVLESIRELPQFLATDNAD